MKKVQWRSIKFNCLFLLMLLAIIVFAPSCEKETINRPTATFIIKGKVVSDDEQKPLENIHVIMLEGTAGLGPLKDVKFITRKDSAITDLEGNFVLIDSLGIPANISYTLILSEAGNGLKSADENIINNTFIQEFKASELTNGDGRWYNGEKTVERIFSFKTK